MTEPKLVVLYFRRLKSFCLCGKMVKYNRPMNVFEKLQTDPDTIKECRQTGRTRTTTKKLLEKAYYEQMTKEIDISTEYS